MLRADAVCYAYPPSRGAAALTAVSGVDLAVERGELVCVSGPNGSGKSTFLKLLGGVLVPDAGSVLLEGSPVARLGARARARAIATVPQVLRALPDVAVRDFVLGGRYPYLGFWGSARAGDGSAVERALSEADVGDLGERTLLSLSGGQRQRVLVARALAQEAELLLFDEPSASLDPGHQVSLFELIGALVAKGRAAVVATHELNLASRFAGRVVLLAEGRLVADGTPAEVLRREVLEPVYGPDLLYARAPGPPERVLVVPWPGRDRPGEHRRLPSR